MTPLSKMQFSRLQRGAGVLAQARAYIVLLLAAGVLSAIEVETGATVQPGAVLGQIAASGAPGATSPAAALADAIRR